MAKVDPYKVKWWRIGYSYPGGDHTILSNEKYRTKMEALKAIQKDVNKKSPTGPYKLSWIASVLKTEEDYIGIDDGVGTRISLGRYNAEDLED